MSSNKLVEFDAVFPEIVEQLTKTGIKVTDTEDAYNWFKGVLQYNVPHGKKNRGISVVSSYRRLVPNATDKDVHIARVLGWCVEMLQAFFLVADDVMDSSITRRGQPCWYKKEGVGLTAINDSYFLEMAIYKLLKRYVKGKTYYMDVTELFHDITMETVVGQCLDMITALPQGKVDFTQFTMERYSAIVKWKTAFYSFYLPVALAMYMAGINDEESHAEAKEILLKMGHFFQVQDDYLDCYGDPEVIGKIGTDIQDNKCGWLAVKALELVTPEQRKHLEACYGRPGEDDINRVKELYSQLELEKVYKQYEESSYQELIHLINKCSGQVPREIYTDFASKIYKRQK